MASRIAASDPGYGASHQSACVAVFDSRVVRNYFQPDAKVEATVVPERPAPVPMVE